MQSDIVKISDYVIDYLVSLGIKNIFLISGGGCIHLIDSVGKNKKIKFICNHHEQASAIAAEAYSRVTEKISACLVTTGPGSTNTLTGLIGAWLDSIPMIFISGQVKRETIADYSKLRQIGDQEINIIDMVKPVTKYAVTIFKEEEISYHMEKAVYLATHGRPGPVWINIPLDIQGAKIQKSLLKHFSQKEIEKTIINQKELKKEVEFIIEKIKKAKRPLLFVGNGVRLSGAQKELLNLISLLKIPVVTGFAGFDMISSSNPYFAGRPGTIGQRSGNFAVQNSDLLLVIGSKLNIRMIGYDFKSFARGAYKIMADIDKEEMSKPTLSIDKKILSDAKDFINEMIIQLKNYPIRLSIENWITKTKYWKKKYPTVLPQYWQEKKVNPYCFIDTLSKYLNKNDVIAVSNATAAICTYQAIRFPQGLRIINNSGCAAMGYGLPAAIGASVANKKGRTICLEGDGSIQMNVQEFQTIVHNKLPLKIFVYNNKGYVSIRLTQNGLFDGRLVASSEGSGVSCPDVIKIAKAYGIHTERIVSHKGMDQIVKKVLSYKGPVVCEIVVSPNMQFMPKSASMQLKDGSFVSRPLEDMAPFLSREELKDNMYISL
ncbi:MAG: thiamine pyrophosphate-binding protein [Patescibacteria group bacterium]